MIAKFCLDNTCSDENISSSFFWGNIFSSPQAQFKIAPESYIKEILSPVASEGASSEQEEIGRKMGELLRTSYGDFSFCVFSPQKHLAVIGRDAIGVAPLYVQKQENSKWAISTSLTGLVQNATDLQLHESYLKKIERFDFSDMTATPFQNIWRCPPAHFGIIDMNGIRWIQYWDLPLPPDSRVITDYDEAIAVGRNVLSEVMKDRVESYRKPTLFLSGGVDSGYLATKLYKEYGDNCDSVPSKFRKTEDHFRVATILFVGEPEADSGGIQYYLNKFGEKIRKIDAAQFVSGEWCFDVRRDPKSILYDPTLWLYRPLLEDAVSAQSEVCMTGLGGDDAFEVGVAALSNLSFHESLKEIQNDFRYEVRRKLYIWFKYWLIIKLQLHLMRILNAFGFSRSTPRVKKQYSIWKVLRKKLLLSGQYPLGIEQEQELAQSYGLRFTYPLLDRRVIEYLCRVHPRLHSSTRIAQQVWGRAEDNLNKPLLRALASEVLSEERCLRLSLQDYSNFRKKYLQEQMGGERDGSSSKLEQTYFDRAVCRMYTAQSKRNVKNSKMGIMQKPCYGGDQNEFDKKGSIKSEKTI